MLRDLRERVRSQNGFTLIEVFVVAMLIGLLAAIALPAFLGSQAKGHDSDAKTSARNVMTAVESCFAEQRAYSSCDSASELEAAGAKVGVDLTDTTAKAKGAVSVTADVDTYTIVGYSQSGNTFSIAKAADGTFSRPCTSGAEAGGCGTETGVW